MRFNNNWLAVKHVGGRRNIGMMEHDLKYHALLLAIVPDLVFERVVERKNTTFNPRARDIADAHACARAAVVAVHWHRNA